MSEDDKNPRSHKFLQTQALEQILTATTTEEYRFPC